MNTKAPTVFEAVAGESVPFLARIRHASGDLATPDNTDSISVRVARMGVVTLTEVLTVADVLFETLQTGDPRWSDDTNDDAAERGYNFLWVAPIEAFPVRSHYRVAFTILDTDGNVTFVRFEGAARTA